MRRITVKFGLRLWLICSICLCTLTLSFAQQSNIPDSRPDNRDVGRILILHGVWAAEFWEWEFDRQFHESLDQLGAANVEVSSVYLGIAQNPEPQTEARQRNRIEALITDQNVDLLVAVLPPAINFMTQLSLPADLPVIVVVPDDNAIPDRGNRPMTIIPSLSATVINETLQQIRTLLPRVTDIEVIIGNGPGDLTYLQRFQEIAAEFSDTLAFDYAVGVPRDELLELAATLPDTTAIMALPYESSGDDYSQEMPESLRRLTDISSVPVFGIFDSQLPFGIAGGHLSSARDYGALAAEQSIALLRGQAPGNSVGRATTIYNWDRVRKWNLPIDRLVGDVELIGRPATVFSDYPFTSTLLVNTIVLLILGMAFLFYRYHRSQQARVMIEKSERKARESEERYRLVTNNALDIIWVWEEGSDYLKFVSPAIQRVTGYSIEEYLAMPITEMMSSADYKILSRAYSEPGATTVTIQIQINHKSGHRVWVELMVQAASLLENGKREWVGVSRDITRRKQNEIERKNLEEQVRQSQKFESLGTLAGGIAHDFNNILTVIIGITDMLRLDSTDEASRARLLDRLHRASDKARRLVQQILTFSRHSKGEKSVVELSSLIENRIGLLISGKPENIEIDIDLHTAPLPVLANGNQLEQIIINLVTNAFEAVADRPGKISLQTYPKILDALTSLTHGQLAAGNYACLKVTDNGSGMDEAELGRAFDPFYTSKELGSGMGLAIVHGIVMDHAGAINVESHAGQGTTIEILLPASDREVTSETPSRRESRVQAGAKRIIVVDDQEELLQVVADMLRQLGHQCITCADPKEALEVIQQQAAELDLIITDYSMPEMNGLELMEQCQQHCPHIPVIISTGYGDFSSRYSSQTLGEICILDKPYDMARLREVVDGTV